MVFFTVTTVDDLPRSIILMNSVSISCPQVERYVFLIDSDSFSVQKQSGLNIVDVSKLGISLYSNFLVGIEKHDTYPFLLPYLMTYLRNEGFGLCFYIHNSCVMYSSADLAVQELERSLCVLVPDEVEYSGFLFNNRNTGTISGNVNFHFIGINLCHSSARRLLAVWTMHNEAIWNQCTDDISSSLKRWHDRLFCLFDEIRMIRSLGYLVSRTNQIERYFHVRNGQYYVGDDKLVVYDHHIGSRQDDRSGMDAKCWAEIQSAYQEQLLAAIADSPIIAKGQGRCDISPLVKWKYRTDGDYRNRVDSSSLDGMCSGNSHGLTAIYRKSVGIAMRARKIVLDCLARVESWKLRKNARPRVLRARGSRTSVSLVGYARSEIGIGQALRLFAQAMNSRKVPFSIANTYLGNTSRMNDLSLVDMESTGTVGRTLLFFLNPPELLRYLRLFRTNLTRTYRIGVWFWETPELTDDFFRAEKCIDELWACSQFLRDNFAANTKKPVIYIPLCVEVPKKAKKNRSSLLLPEATFLFMTMYDVHSSFERKNVDGVIRAFQMMGLTGLECGLVVKINNSYTCPAQVQKLRAIDGLDGKVIFVDENYDRQDVHDLIACCDAFISLHRAEGFGLGIAEAMALAKPVVATNWSGNTDFMTPENSYPVDYSLIKLDRDYGPYRKGSTWAEPDIEHASTLMRQVLQQPEEARVRGERAKRTIERDFSLQRVGGLIEKRLAEIAGRRKILR